jgi:L-ascorbate metabolism protein UlaG (beta-lactamase superfamily)
MLNGTTMKITYYGHFCFSVYAGGENILFDPFITPNEQAKDINVDQIKVCKKIIEMTLGLYLPAIRQQLIYRPQDLFSDFILF